MRMTPVRPAWRLPPRWRSASPRAATTTTRDPPAAAAATPAAAQAADRSPASSPAPAPAPRKPRSRPGSRASRRPTPTSPSPTTRSGPAAAASSSSPAASPFAGTDAALNDDELDRRPEALRRRRQPHRDPGLHLADRGRLQPRGRRRPAALARDARADLQAEITTWDDAGDQGRQPGREPARTTRITVVQPLGRVGHDRRTSPTTSRRPRRTPGPTRPDDDWPVKGGEAAQGTSGVVDAIKNGKGTIGYADESQAGDLGRPRSRSATTFVAPSRRRAAKILEVSKETDDPGKYVFTYDLDRNDRRREHLPDRRSSPTRSPAPRTTTPAQAKPWSRAT